MIETGGTKPKALQSLIGVNSTITPLSGGATFTGIGEQNNYPDVFVSCYSDVSCTLFIDFSVDNVNWTTFPSAGFTVAAGFTVPRRSVKAGRYCRVRVTNGASAQSSFRLYTYFGDFKQLSSPINQSISADADATVVRSFPESIDKALGRFGGVQADGKFGYASGLTTAIQIGTPSTWVDLWAYGGQRTTQTSSFTPYMASSDAGDTDIDISFTYLDASGYEQTVTVSTDASDGRTPVALGITALDVFTANNSDSTDLAGNLYCTTINNYTNGVPDEQDEVLVVIPVNNGRSQVLARRIPVDKKCVINSMHFTLTRNNGSAASAEISFDVRQDGGVWQSRRPIGLSDAAAYDESGVGITLEPLSEFRVRIRDVSDNTCIINGTLDYDMVEI